MIMPKNIQDLTGLKFGRLLVVEYSHTDKYRHPHWLCKCDCGSVKIANGHSLTSGGVTKCKYCPINKKIKPKKTKRVWISAEDKFEKNIMPAIDGCHYWIGSTLNTGYGVIYSKGTSILAHRFSYEFYFKKSPGNLSVCHHCDNPLCVNPNHFFLGTQADNNRDRSIKGRTKGFVCSPKAWNAGNHFNKTFGDLIVKSQPYRNSRGLIWECACSCGAVVMRSTSDLNANRGTKCNHQK